jgi:hypothetical protein
MCYHTATAAAFPALLLLLLIFLPSICYLLPSLPPSSSCSSHLLIQGLQSDGLLATGTYDMNITRRDLPLPPSQHPVPLGISSTSDAHKPHGCVAAGHMAISPSTTQIIIGLVHQATQVVW